MNALFDAKAQYNAQNTMFVTELKCRKNVIYNPLSCFSFHILQSFFAVLLNFLQVSMISVH